MRTQKIYFFVAYVVIACVISETFAGGDPEIDESFEPYPSPSSFNISRQFEEASTVSSKNSVAEISSSIVSSDSSIKSIISVFGGTGTSLSSDSEYDYEQLSSSVVKTPSSVEIASSSVADMPSEIPFSSTSAVMSSASSSNKKKLSFPSKSSISSSSPGEPQSSAEPSPFVYKPLDACRYDEEGFIVNSDGDCYLYCDKNKYMTFFDTDDGKLYCCCE